MWHFYEGTSTEISSKIWDNFKNRELTDHPISTALTTDKRQSTLTSSAGERENTSLWLLPNPGWHLCASHSLQILSERKALSSSNQVEPGSEKPSPQKEGEQNSPQFSGLSWSEDGSCREAAPSTATPPPGTHRDSWEHKQPWLPTVSQATRMVTVICIVTADSFQKTSIWMCFHQLLPKCQKPPFYMEHLHFLKFLLSKWGLIN